MKSAVTTYHSRHIFRNRGHARDCLSGKRLLSRLEIVIPIRNDRNTIILGTNPVTPQDEDLTQPMSSGAATELISWLMPGHTNARRDLNCICLCTYYSF